MKRRTFIQKIACGAAVGAVGFTAVAGAEETPPKPAPLPEGIKGFQGMLIGTLTKKGEKDLVVKVEKITRVWKGNKAKDPKCIIGKEVPMDLWAKSRLYKKHLETLKTLKVGDRIVVEPFHFEGERLSVVEELKKAEAEAKDKPQ